ncbi:uncharacterized protein LOC120427071 [Culex pipiens pallens]|uniref:uncharacterized protein LOC120427071 n=1 Tax=Culex pipiens pallens TaxID=42434 RepID=UPI0019539833|nr:uncharacterized protein LOC120427071 [Culex pipiens pallens]
MSFPLLIFLLEVVFTVQGRLLPQADRPCHEDRFYNLGSQIIDHYFGDRHYITVIKTKFDGEELAEAFECEVHHRPFYIVTQQRFQYQVNLERYTTPNNIYEYPSFEAFLAWGSEETLLTRIIPYIAIRNPQAKVILRSYLLSRDEVAHLFYQSWYMHNMLNVLVINYLDRHRIELCVFNPYAMVHGGDVDVRAQDLNCTLITDENQLAGFLRRLDRFERRRVRKLNGYNLTVAMHESKGSMSAFDCILDNFHISDVDMDILKIIQEKMRFNATYINSELELSVGYVNPNGSMAGVLLLIESNKIDLAANSRIIHDYGTKNLLYLRYITTEKLMFLVPRNYFENRDKEIVFINPFSITYLIVNMIFSIVIPLLLLALEKILKYVRPAKRNYHFGVSVLCMIGIIYNVSVKQPKATRKRFVIFGLLVYNIVSYPVWQAVTIRYLNSDNQNLNNINTLEELLETDLELRVSKYHHHVVVHEGSDFQNPSYRELSTRLNTKDTSSIRTAIERIITQRDSAFLTSETYVPLVLSGSYNWIPGSTSSGVFVISEPIYEFYKSMVVPKTSPFVRTFNEIVMRCIETGFVERQTGQLRMVVDVLNIRQTLANARISVERLFDMGSLKIFFVFYLVMMALATVVFLLELAVNRYCKKKKMELGAVEKIEEEKEDEELFEFVL